jgi:hypothetical protein
MATEARTCCLQGQKILGYIGNTGIEAWSGKAVFFSPRLNVDNVEVEIEYSVQYLERESQEDFLTISVRPD